MARITCLLVTLLSGAFPDQVFSGLLEKSCPSASLAAEHPGSVPPGDGKVRVYYFALSK